MASDGHTYPYLYVFRYELGQISGTQEHRIHQVTEGQRNETCTEEWSNFATKIDNESAYITKYGDNTQYADSGNEELLLTTGQGS